MGDDVIGSMSLSQISSVTGGEYRGEDVRFARVSTDTRTLQQDDLYVALRGENFDGNEFVSQAFDKGACAAVVSAALNLERPHVQVKDTTVALGEIARLNRQASRARVVAITGSQGKTTVKEMIAAILGVANKVLVTRGNLNNHIGVPLTLLALDASHECAVIELGASGLGEIAYTVRLAMPHVAVLTNAAATHIEGFGDLAGVVRTKGEIIDGLLDGGVAVLNADDVHFEQWRARAGDKVVLSFGLRDAADYRASDIRLYESGSSVFTLHTPHGTAEIQLALAGSHNVRNALAAAAAAMAAGASLDQVRQGLAQVAPVPGRLNWLTGRSGVRLIDDSYNASPASFRAAIDVLAALPGHRVLIVGDMGELGEQSESAHAELGQYAREKGVDALWATGVYSALAARSFGPDGRHFATQDALIAEARQTLGKNDVVLVKGSRSAAMDRVIAQLKQGESE